MFFQSKFGHTLIGHIHNKRRKNCDSSPIQVTWKSSLNVCQICLSCLLCPVCLVFPVCPGCPVCPDDHDETMTTNDHDQHNDDDHVDHDVYGNHDDRLNHGDFGDYDQHGEQLDIAQNRYLKGVKNTDKKDKKIVITS